MHQKATKATMTLLFDDSATAEAFMKWMAAEGQELFDQWQLGPYGGCGLRLTEMDRKLLKSWRIAL